MHRVSGSLSSCLPRWLLVILRHLSATRLRRLDITDRHDLMKEGTWQA